VKRASDATTRGNSIRKTASTAAVESEAGTPPIQPPGGAAARTAGF
jgi:hypothetical protein